MAHEVGARHSLPWWLENGFAWYQCEHTHARSRVLSKADLTEAQKLLSRDLPVVRVSKAPW